MDFKEMRTSFCHTVVLRQQELSRQLSDLSNKEQDILHFIENEKYDAVVMVKMAKQLKIVRKQRRELKVEYEQTQSLMSSLTSGKLDSFENKGYTYKTNIIEDRPKGYVWHKVQ